MRYLNCLCFSIVSIAIVEVSAVKARQSSVNTCWDEPKSEIPLGSLCFYDDTSHGRGMQLGKISSISADEQPAQLICRSEHEPSGTKPSSKNYHWLRIRQPLNEIHNMASDIYMYDFIQQFEYCQEATQGTKRFPDIKQLAISQENPVICSGKSKSGSLILGFLDDDEYCSRKVASIKTPFEQASKEPLETTSSPDSSRSSSAPNADNQQPRWVESKREGWPIRTKSDDLEKKHFKCKKHCRDKAKKEALRLNHKYVGYDGNNWYTGQDVDWADREGSNGALGSASKLFGGKEKNRIYINENYKGNP